MALFAFLGDALIAAKKLVKHGEFKAWVEANCRCSYDSAVKYMRVAKVAAKSGTQSTFEGGINAFLEAHSTPRKITPEPPPQFTHDDAEYALKLNAMATRGTGPEQAIAASKLDSFAKQFGMAGGEVISHAHDLIPDADKSAYQAAADREAAVAKEATAKLHAAEERLTALEAKLRQVMNRKAEIKAELVSHSKDELIDMLADAYLQLEQPL